jgi:hypothetical protein
METEKFEKDGEEPQFRFKALQGMVVMSFVLGEFSEVDQW